MRVFMSVKAVQPGAFERSDPFETVLQLVAAFAEDAPPPHKPDHDGYVVLIEPGDTDEEMSKEFGKSPHELGWASSWRGHGQCLCGLLLRNTSLPSLPD